MSQKDKKTSKKPTNDFNKKERATIRKGKKPLGYTERPKTE